MGIKRCECCAGRKYVTGMGGMKKDCEVCHAIGWVEDRDNAQNENNEIKKQPEVKQRRQRIEVK